MNHLIIRTVVRVVAPLVLIFSFYLLLRGHNAPGGGFIAGLMSALAIILEYIAFGIQHIKRFSRSLPYIFTIGLAIALGTGIWGIVSEGFFLQSNYGFPLPVNIEIASAAIFDFGVYLVVVGVVLSILTYLAEEEPIQ